MGTHGTHDGLFKYNNLYLSRMYFLSTPSFSLSLSALHPRVQRGLPQGGPRLPPGMRGRGRRACGPVERGGQEAQASGVRGCNSVTRARVQLYGSNLYGPRIEPSYTVCYFKSQLISSTYVYTY